MRFASKPSHNARQQQPAHHASAQASPSLPAPRAARVSPRARCRRAQGAPKLKVAIVGGGLAGLSTAVELLDQG